MTAVLFDCDGVLIDSENLSVTELGHTLRRAGANISDADIFQRMIGRPIAEILSMVLEEQGCDASSFLPEYGERLRARFEADLQPMRGMRQVIDAVPVGSRAVASSSTLPRLEHSLQLTELWDLFAPHVYSATQVARGKPAPDLFLFVANQLGVAPADCIVIEDSPTGIQAARAAGMRVIAFLGGSHAGAARLAERVAPLMPDAIIADAADLPEALRRMTEAA
ncbi:MAG: HAD family hydrolase [Paracoccus sp. (in: a-proteobacteria)]